MDQSSEDKITTNCRQRHNDGVDAQGGNSAELEKSALQCQRYQNGRKGRPAEWVLKTTLDDLKTSKNLHQDPATKQKLEMVIEELEKLLGPENKD